MACGSVGRAHEPARFDLCSGTRSASAASSMRSSCETDPDRGLRRADVRWRHAAGADRETSRSASAVRVRIPAREIILATSAPDGLSLHNVVPGTVSALHAERRLDHVVVQIAVGHLRLLAEVTRDAVARLRIAVGLRLYALIKSVSIDLQAMQSAEILGQESLENMHLE